MKKSFCLEATNSIQAMLTSKGNVVALDWNKIREDYEAAYFSAELCLESPRGEYSIEEMESIIFDMEMSTAEVDEALRLEFHSMSLEAQAKMLELLHAADSEHFDYWEKTLLDHS